jgi:hypothetical protein
VRIVKGPDFANGCRQEACTVQHPGALCCTKWKLAQSPGGGAVTVKMETTCEQQGDITTHELDMEDYVALALRVRPLAALAAPLPRLCWTLDLSPLYRTHALSHLVAP